MTTRRRILWAALATALLFVVSFATLGLPGALVLEPAEAILARLGARPLTGDAVWPAAIVVAFLMPFGILISAIVLARIGPATRAWASAGWAALGYFAVGMLVSSLILVSR